MKLNLLHIGLWPESIAVKTANLVKKFATVAEVMNFS